MRENREEGKDRGNRGGRGQRTDRMGRSGQNLTEDQAGQRDGESGSVKRGREKKRKGKRWVEAGHGRGRRPRAACRPGRDAGLHTGRLLAVWCEVRRSVARLLSTAQPASLSWLQRLSAALIAGHGRVGGSRRAS